MAEREQSPSGYPQDAAPPPVEHLNIKVTDGNNEVFFKIKRTTKLDKLMNAFCERQGKQMSTVRFLFDGQRVQPGDSPENVGSPHVSSVTFYPYICSLLYLDRVLDLIGLPKQHTYQS